MSPTVLRNTPGRPSTQPHGEVDGVGVAQRLVPGGGEAVGIPGPRRAADRLDRLHGDAAVGAHRRELLEVGEVPRVLRHGEVVGQQDRGEVELLQRAQVLAGDVHAVAGHADRPDQALVEGPHRALQRAARVVRGLPLDLVDQVVQLDQVDVVDAQALQRLG